MKQLTLAILLTLGFQTVFAAPTPYARNCRILGGQFWIIQFTTDDMPLCLFGEAVIEGGTLFAANPEFKSNIALTTYLATNLNNKTQSCETYCREHEGLIQVGVDTEGMHFKMCVFKDNSAIGLETLGRGFQDPKNKNLNKALGYF